MSLNTNNENHRNGDVKFSNDGASSLFSSYDGEESFVVLERSTANDVGLGINGERSSLLQSFQTSQVDCSFPVFNNHLTNGVTSNQLSSHSQAATAEALDTSNVTSVSAEEIDKRLQEVLHENIVLKENLRQTNLAMKQQLSTVSLLQDRALEAQKKQQIKFEETKTLILKLGSEKNELMEANEALSQERNKLNEENKEINKTVFAFKEETAKLVSENASLKSQVTALQETLKTTAESNRKTSLQPTTKEAELHALVEQLSRKLEAVERSRRQQEFDIERLQAQLGRVNTELTETQRKLALAENALQTAQMPPKTEQDVPIQYGEKMMKYDALLKQLKANIQEEQTNCNSLISFLSFTDPTVNLAQFEISELRRLLAEEQTQSVNRKENLYQAASTIHEMLADIQKLGEELERVKADHVVKESHSHAYEEVKMKSYSQKLDEVTAQLVQKEEALAIAERHLASLQEAVRLNNAEKKEDGGEAGALKEHIQNLSKQNSLKEENLQAVKETISVLEEQAKIYQVDFEAERKAREQLVAEKGVILEDLRHLQRRNQELLDELTRVRGEVSGQSQRRTSAPHGHSPSPPPPRLEQTEIFCPISNCNRRFNSKDELNLHMFNCWSNQYTSTFSQQRKPNVKCTRYGCKMTFPSWDEYTLHFQLQHSTRDAQRSRLEPRPKLLCPFCKVSFADSQEHGRHLSSCAWSQNRDPSATLATEDPKLSCPNCSTIFNNEGNLTRHVYECWKISDE